MTVSRKALKPATRAKPGPKPIYTHELADRICAELACGRSLVSVCGDKGMPARETVFSWIRTNPDFRAQYEKAKAESADALVEEMLDIADDTSGDYVDDGEGNMVFSKENVMRARLRIDTRKWISSKLKPKRFGDQVDVNHGVQDTLSQFIQSIQGNTFQPVPQTLVIDHMKDDDNDDE